MSRNTSKRHAGPRERQASGTALGNGCLALFSVALVLGVAEMSCRALAYHEDRNDLARGLETWQKKTEKHENLPLAGLIQRAESPRIIYELRPRLDVRFMNRRVTTNEHGFRDKAYTREKPPGVSRIVGIGDSIMWGWRLEQGEDFLSLLEKELNATRSQPRWDVVNTAVPGYNTVLEVETLVEKGLGFDPGVVIVAFSGNDLDLPNFLLTPRNPLSLGRSFLVEYFVQRAARKRREDVDPVLAPLGLVSAPEKADGKGYARDPARVPRAYRDMVGWEGYVRTLERLAGLAEEHGFEVVQVFFRPGNRGIKRRAMARCRELGFHVVDMGVLEMRYMREHGFPRQAYFSTPLVQGPDDPHPSALLHEMTARELARYLRDEGLLRSKPEEQ